MFACICGGKKAKLRKVISMKTAVSQEIIECPTTPNYIHNLETDEEDPHLEVKLILIRKQFARYVKEVLSRQFVTVKPDLNLAYSDEVPLYKQENGSYFYVASTLIL